MDFLYLHGMCVYLNKLCVDLYIDIYVCVFVSIYLNIYIYIDLYAFFPFVIFAWLLYIFATFRSILCLFTWI